MGEIKKREVKKAKFALFWGNEVLAGECRYTAKKYPDGMVIVEMTYTTTLPKKKK
jgi:hypothetical protein